jgi:hypothetical protein
MAHIHVNEYQIRIAHEDGTEELTAWMNSEQQLTQVLATLHKVHRKAYWLRVRSGLCVECSVTEQPIIVECPITGIASARYRPHNSRYLVAVGSRNGNELPEGIFGN